MLNAGPLAYFHTLRHLKPVQVYGRIKYRLSSPAPDLSPAPPLRARGAAWIEPPRRPPTLVGPTSFDLLGETRDLADHGWDDPRLERLWRYNLHYFDDLNAERAGERAAWHEELLRLWVRENAPGAGTGWEPYPTSLRIVNWVKWVLGGGTLPPPCEHSLAVQARWLAQRLERHLLGNHLLANAKALAFAGAFFDGEEARRWQRTAFEILDHEVPEQILADGGHFELSPMYHALVLEDLLDLINLARVYAPEWARSPGAHWGRQVAVMREWLAAMSHPDGQIAFFNDAAFGVASGGADLDAYAVRLGLPPCPPARSGLTRLTASGYVRMARGPLVAFLDIAPIGPDYLPAHGHADTLSFEVSLFGRRVFVNSGTSCYGSGSERLRQRGTAAHNTVVIDGQNSSEVWSGFRVARRARPLGVEIEDGDTACVRAAHDGYRRLPGKPVHVRTWSLGERALTVRDEVSGRFGHAQARFHLHPGVRVEAGALLPEARVVLRLPDGRTAQFAVEGGALRVEPSTWHPQFGRSEQSRCLVVDMNGPCIRASLSWDDPR